MVYKERVGTTFLVSVVLWSTLTLFFIALSIAMWSIWLAVIAGAFLLANIYFIPAIKKKIYYEFASDCLFIKAGRYELKIPYSNITSVSQIKSMLMVPTTSSFVRLEINYINSSGTQDFVHISPKNKQEFINQLEQRRK
jgi:membrane protein YdbS with pleckstrin-like domain